MKTRVGVTSKSMLMLLLVSQLFVAVWAQSDVVLRGRIEDPAGAAIPKVQISVTGKRGSFTAVSDENGEYELTLPVGAYRIGTAKAPGFAATKKKLVIKAGAPVTYNLHPQIDLSTADCVLRVTSS
jgi:hypothetical protein